MPQLWKIIISEDHITGLDSIRPWIGGERDMLHGSLYGKPLCSNDEDAAEKKKIELYKCEFRITSTMPMIFVEYAVNP